MANIIVVEPNEQRRAGIYNALHTLPEVASCTAMDYARLFVPPTRREQVDLALLSAPQTREQLVEVLAAAQQKYWIKALVVLTETESLPYSVAGVSDVLRGNICKDAPVDVLLASVSLVLAGGYCFRPEQSLAQDDAPTVHKSGHNRRWYDNKRNNQAQIVASQELVRKTPSTVPTAAIIQTDDSPTDEDEPTKQDSWPVADLIRRHETKLLQLTPRQYEVLALMARGHPLKSISQMLDISLATSKTHTSAIYQRLAVNNRQAAVYAAVSRGATLGLYEHDSSTPAT